LPTKRYFHSSDLPWATAFIKCFEKIKSELTSAITEGSELRPYLGSGDAIPTNLSTLAGSLNWAALDLYKNGELQTAAKSLFPNTLAAFEDVPTYQLTNSPYEIFFSLLKPGQTIAPHYGQSNHSLTAHLALDIPDSCYLEVDHEQRIWREGELMVFDDNYLHSAHNASDKTRIVLIFSIWNPDLSAVERAAIRHAFKSRQQWMLSRREKLNQLLITN
jgi:aspartyl/asparaginyl beta-hydroxylase (cupin superfamily)